MLRTIAVFLFIVLSSPLLTVQSFAETKLVSAKDVDEVLNAARGFGSASLGTDSVNDPKITGRIEGIKYTMLFYGCNDNNENCKSISLSAAWGGTDVTMSDINDWNRVKRFGKAYLDSDGDPVLEMQINLDHGVSQANLEDTIDWWAISLARFKDEVIDN